MCKKELNVIEEPSLNADAEIIWVKLTPITKPLSMSAPIIGLLILSLIPSYNSRPH